MRVHTAEPIWSLGSPMGFGGEVGHTAMGEAQTTGVSSMIGQYAGDLLTFRAAESPSDLLPEPAPQVALLTIVKADNEPAYLDEILSWHPAALASLHRTLEGMRLRTADGEAPRMGAHTKVIARLREVQSAQVMMRRVRTIGGVLLIGGLGYGVYRLVT